MFFFIITIFQILRLLIESLLSRNQSNRAEKKQIIDIDLISYNKKEIYISELKSLKVRLISDKYIFNIELDYIKHQQLVICYFL